MLQRSDGSGYECLVGTFASKEGVRRAFKEELQNAEESGYDVDLDDGDTPDTANVAQVSFYKVYIREADLFP